MSACALGDGVGLSHLPAYSRRLDGLWGMYQWLPSSDADGAHACGRPTLARIRAGQGTNTSLPRMWPP